MESSRDTAAADWFEGPLGARVLREEAALAPLVLDDVFGFELLQMGAWGPARHLLDGARTQHTTLVAPQAGPGVTLCAAARLAAVALRFHRRDFFAAHPRAGGGSLRGAARSRTSAVRAKAV